MGCPRANVKVSSVRSFLASLNWGRRISRSLSGARVPCCSPLIVVHHAAQQGAACVDVMGPARRPRGRRCRHHGQHRVNVAERAPGQAEQLAVGESSALGSALRACFQGAPLGRPAMVVEHHRFRPEMSPSLRQQARQHAHAVAQQTAVGRRQDVRPGSPCGRPARGCPLHPRVAGRAQQAPVDALPSVRAHRPHGRLQRRLLRAPSRVHAREATRGLRVTQGELKPAPGLLAQMLSTAQRSTLSQLRPRRPRQDLSSAPNRQRPRLGCDLPRRICDHCGLSERQHDRALSFAARQRCPA